MKGYLEHKRSSQCKQKQLAKNILVQKSFLALQTFHNDLNDTFLLSLVACLFESGCQATTIIHLFAVEKRVQVNITYGTPIILFR